MLDQNKVNQFFLAELLPIEQRIKYYNALPKSGWTLLSELADTDRVLDVGCEHNLFKTRRENLVGIDPVGDAADVKIAVQDWVTSDRFDVAFCLGSLQFGDINDIRAVVSKLIALLNPKARIFWRTSLEKPAGAPDFFRWNTALHQQLAAEFGFDLVEVLDEEVTTSTGAKIVRLYAEWRRG